MQFCAVGLPADVEQRLQSCCGSTAVTEEAVAFTRCVLTWMYADAELAPILSREEPTFGPEPTGWVMVEWDKFSFSVGPTGVCSVWSPEELEGDFVLPRDVSDALCTAKTAFFG